MVSSTKVAAPVQAEPGRLRDLMSVNPRPSQPEKRRIIIALYVAAIVNFGACAAPLVNSVLHHLFPDRVGNYLVQWADRTEPNRPYLLWIWLGYGVLWGVFFLYIAAAPLLRRSWLSFAIAEKLVTTVSTWVGYLVLHDVSIALPLIVLGTDLAFVFVFGWARRTADRIFDGMSSGQRRDYFRSHAIPMGSSPVARWLLRAVGLITFVAAIVVLVSSLYATLLSSEKCGTTQTTLTDCQLLDTVELRSNYPFLVWIWAGMELVVAAALFWAARDPVRRRDIIPFGIGAKLIPVLAIAVAQFSSTPEWNPGNTFSTVMIAGGLTLAAGLWMAARSADAAGLGRAIVLDDPELTVDEDESS